ncbi:hypothetical protein ACQJBY_012626 [Aegilops geniculata]
MGATASCFYYSSLPPSPSPSPPSKCSVWETMSATRLFTVPDYSKWALMRPGSALLFDHALHLLGYSYDVKVYPAGYVKAKEEAVCPAGYSKEADFVAVFAEPTTHRYYSKDMEASRISMEILDGSGERTVFDNHTVTSRQNGKLNTGYVWFVKRRELEASGCLHGDSFTIRCTASADVQVTRSSAEVMEALTAAASDPSKTQLTGSHVLTIDRFSKIKAVLRTGDCVHSTQFSLGGSNWYFKVYPNGSGRYGDRTSCGMSVFLGRGRSNEPATTAEFRFEMGDQKEVRSTKHTFRHHDPEHEFPYFQYFAGKTIDDDRLVVRCHVRVIKAETPN